MINPLFSLGLFLFQINSLQLIDNSKISKNIPIEYLIQLQYINDKSQEPKFEWLKTDLDIISNYHLLKSGNMLLNINEVDQIVENKSIGESIDALLGKYKYRWNEWCTPTDNRNLEYHLSFKYNDDYVLECRFQFSISDNSRNYQLKWNRNMFSPSYIRKRFNNFKKYTLIRYIVRKEIIFEDAKNSIQNIENCVNIPFIKTENYRTLFIKSNYDSILKFYKF